MPQLQALSTRFVIERIEIENTTSSGIILQNPQDLHPRARIISRGPRVDADVAVGAECMVDWRRAVEVKHADRSYYVIDQSDVMAVFE